MTGAPSEKIEPSASPSPPHRDHILILDDDRERVNLIRCVLLFLDYEPSVVSADTWKKSAEKLGVEVGFVVGECGSATSIPQLVKEIHAWDTTIPICVLDLNEQGASSPINEAEYPWYLRYVKYPLRHSQLINALEQGQIYRESKRRKLEGQSIHLFRALVGNSLSVQRVRHFIHQVAPTDATALILGETGTGKEIAARNIHYYSKRREHPFVAVNCGAIPAELLESELFGHEKGAFTGAITTRQGRFEMANGGTLFLDEIGDMPLPMQVKLLRVLQERTFERVGSAKSLTVDVRVVAATHRDLEQWIATGHFREDLYYRVNVFPIEMPPLRERLDDLPLLVNELITRFEASRKGSVRLTLAAINALCLYSWPGNVRELANLIERLAILHPFGIVDIADLPEKFRPDADVNALKVMSAAQHTPAPPTPSLYDQPRLPREGLDLKQHLSNLEIGLINQALNETGGVVAQAATLLGMRRTTLVEKMRKYGIQRQD